MKTPPRFPERPVAKQRHKAWKTEAVKYDGKLSKGEQGRNLGSEVDSYPEMVSSNRAAWKIPEQSF